MKKIESLSKDINIISKKELSGNLKTGKYTNGNKRLSVWAQEQNGRNKRTSEPENKQEKLPDPKNKGKIGQKKKKSAKRLRDLWCQTKGHNKGEEEEERLKKCPKK